MPKKLDLDHFAKLVSRLAATHAGDNEREQLAALAIANQLLAAAGLTWADFVCLAMHAETVEAAVKEAIREANELRERVTELERAAPEWNTVAAPVVRASQIANWLFDLERQGRIWLTDWEHGFLDTMRRWRGPPSQKQAPILQRIVDRVRRTTGLQPPP